ncbi:hypothetical protein SAMN04487867_12974 [Vreelandella titanicae]|uniref:hypothetical protein n=1 Tax=Vreelandella titanicae TaxID=664683 RepID=UPI00088C75BC|nr:hypothetical protein [Halomonas titanicae]SDJ24314.1 hypothetical protein SAMN04487867_12974 [Halomonas titanicae]
MFEIGALVTTIKATVELAKSAKDVNDQAQINAAISDIMERLMAVQSELFSKQQENHALLEEVKLLKAKIESDQRFEKYRLQKTPMGYYTMPLRDEFVTEDQPRHSICHVCREKGIRSILSENKFMYACPTCEHKAWKASPPKKGSRGVVKSSLT